MQPGKRKFRLSFKKVASKIILEDNITVLPATVGIDAKIL
ncbi:hypothetical protein N824_02415 [Pedobacter sp. V48]|nr:hypothetical protein N824_02415 [Pedobacter sp. V48]